MRRTAAATLLVGLVGGTWLVASPGASAITIGPVTVTTPPVPTSVPSGSTVSTVLSQVTVPPSVTVPTPPVALPVPVSVPDVVGTVQTCASFATQTAAQAALALDPALGAALDDDGDGVACELLSALPVDVPGVAPSGGTGQGDAGPTDASFGSSGAAAPSTRSAGVPAVGGSAPAPVASAGSAAASPAAAEPSSLAPRSPVNRVNRPPVSATTRSGGVAAHAATLASAPVAGRDDGDAPQGNVAVTVLAALLVLATAAGAFRQWKAEGLGLAT